MQEARVCTLTHTQKQAEDLQLTVSVRPRLRQYYDPHKCFSQKSWRVTYTCSEPWQKAFHIGGAAGVSIILHYPRVLKPNGGSSLFYCMMLQPKNSISNPMFLNALPKMERVAPRLDWVLDARVHWGRWVSHRRYITYWGVRLPLGSDPPLMLPPPFGSVLLNNQHDSRQSWLSTSSQVKKKNLLFTNTVPPSYVPWIHQLVYVDLLLWCYQ